MSLTKQCTWCPWFWSKALSIFQELLWFVSWELHANFLSGFMAVNFCIYHFLKLCEDMGLKTGLTEISSMSLSLGKNSLFQECKSNGFWDSKVLYLWWVIIFPRLMRVTTHSSTKLTYNLWVVFKSIRTNFAKVTN